MVTTTTNKWNEQQFVWCFACWLTFEHIGNGMNLSSSKRMPTKKKKNKESNNKENEKLKTKLGMENRVWKCSTIYRLVQKSHAHEIWLRIISFFFYHRCLRRVIYEFLHTDCLNNNQLRTYVFFFFVFVQFRSNTKFVCSAWKRERERQRRERKRETV